MSHTAKETRRAVHIAAVVMQAAGLCRDDPMKCRRLYVSDVTCAQCIERWLLSKARRELRRKST